MTPLLPGPALLATLRQELADTADAFEGLAEILPHVNEHGLRDRTRSILATGRTVLRAHAESPGTDIANLLDNLVRGLLTLDIPTRDPDLGITRTLVQLQAATGLAVARLAQAQKAAAALGWMVTNPALPAPLGASVSRDEAPHSLARIVDGLELIAHRLDRIEAESAKGNAVPTVQQQGLVNVYLGEMRVQLDIARMQLSVGDRTIDFAALWRAGAAMADLTEDFIATVRTLAARFFPALRTAVERTRRSLRTVVGYVAATARRIVAGRREAERHTTEVLLEPPPDFLHEEVKRRILAREPVPSAWCPFVRELDFSIEWRSLRHDNESARDTIARIWDSSYLQILDDVSSLSQFSNLEQLNISGCPVRAFNISQFLPHLKKIDISYTNFESLNDFSNVNSLVHIGFGATKIHDVTPISQLPNLEIIDAGGSNIKDISPLSNLPKLHTLSIMSTSVTDISSVNNFPSLKVIYVINTHIPNDHGISSSRDIQIFGNDGMRRSWQPLRGPIPPGRRPPRR